ncbi:spindle and kinetochore-associated protein 3 isoform X2 [Gymnodraco acuticeps]|uniref:Spindle and kinetochore-associated protein 3 isoform X2 n=1 Tax=Gymnodraco acuticeps TaxID=8218 RepID=A0A6P8TI51_GYMAC|nr:spindle and kinetochore-associated protein 3 isoform X2 [Gymnodraco acuticeps]
MNPTVPFFDKLKKLAVNLESETVKLQHDFEHRNNDDNDDDDSETTARAMRTYHQMNCEVGNLKGQLQGQIAELKARENYVDSFIKASRVMQKKVTKDIQALKGHWEKYGYQAPRDTQRASKAIGQQSKAAGEESEDNEAGEEEGESQEEAGGSPSSSPQTAKPPAFTDVMRTPRLSDFGLSEMQLKKSLADCSEVPPMPEMSLPYPSLYEPAPPPPMPFTPKCALRMDDEDLRTPLPSDFGLTEYTMCLNNDFTMDLFKKNVEKPQRPSQDRPEPPVNALMESLNTQESPRRLGNLPTTPEVPAFLTPYMNRLVSSNKSAQQPGNSEEDSHFFESSRTGAIGSKRPWEYDVPEISSMGAEDMEMPEMPNLESILGNSLQKRSEKMLRKTFNITKDNKEPTVNSLDLDGPTQNFSFGTPRIRMDYGEPTTPEMPDLSSVTQDICKLVSQARLKNPTIAVVHPNIRGGNYKNRLSVVSESEFQTLPKYMRLMTLHNLNEVVEHINTFTAESEGEHTEFQMEELQRICMVGTKTPIFILCLMELKRLKHIGGARNTAVYKLCTQK